MRQNVEQPMEEVRTLAAELLVQSERCIMAGLLRQGQALLIEVWNMAAGHDLAVGDHAAWDLAGLLLHQGNYEEAAGWLNRVTAPPAHQAHLWPLIRDGLIALCRQAGAVVSPGSPSLPDATSHGRLPPLRVRALGCFQINRAGTILPICATRKATAILRFLLTRRHRSATREELMELLWPDVPPREAAHSLHVAVSTLRRWIDPPGGSYLRFVAGTYLIDPDATVDHDCDAFIRLSDSAEQCLRAGDIERAQRFYLDTVACYQGDYYVDDRDPGWALAERERLLARYLLALDQLGRLLSAQGRLEAAIECYQALLDRDSYREDIHARLMQCYWQLGRRGAALQQYERGAAVLLHDLGLEPMAEIQALYRAIAG